MCEGDGRSVMCEGEDSVITHHTSIITFTHHTSPITPHPGNICLLVLICITWQQFSMENNCNYLYHNFAKNAEIKEWNFYSKMLFKECVKVPFIII